MRNTIIVVDNFYRQPVAVRRYALGSEFYHPYESPEEVKAGEKPTWSATVFKEAKACPFKSSEPLISELESITGEQIDREFWDRSFPIGLDNRPTDDCVNDPQRGSLWNCSFHVKFKTGQKLGESVHNHVFDDWNSAGANGWAGLIYLNRAAPVTGGLHLWRNRNPERDMDWMTSPKNWELHDTFANVYNRLVLVRGDIPHSGADGWSNSMERGRLYQTFFFRVTSTGIRRPGLTIHY